MQHGWFKYGDPMTQSKMKTPGLPPEHMRAKRVIAENMKHDFAAQHYNIRVPGLR